ncbi:MAG: hypothetical protein WDW36_010002 [Sanguina aurantia]
MRETWKAQGVEGGAAVPWGDSHHGVRFALHSTASTSRTFSSCAAVVAGMVPQKWRLSSLACSTKLRCTATTSGSSASCGGRVGAP